MDPRRPERLNAHEHAKRVVSAESPREPKRDAGPRAWPRRCACCKGCRAAAACVSSCAPRWPGGCRTCRPTSWAWPAHWRPALRSPPSWRRLLVPSLGAQERRRRRLPRQLRGLAGASCAPRPCSSPPSTPRGPPPAMCGGLHVLRGGPCPHRRHCSVECGGGVGPARRFCCHPGRCARSADGGGRGAPCQPLWRAGPGLWPCLPQMRMPRALGALGERSGGWSPSAPRAACRGPVADGRARAHEARSGGWARARVRGQPGSEVPWWPLAAEACRSSAGEREDPPQNAARESPRCLAMRGDLCAGQGGDLCAGQGQGDNLRERSLLYATAVRQRLA